MIQNFVDQPAENPSPLFRLQIEKILANEEFVVGVLKRNPLEILAILGKIRNSVDNSNPEEARLFCSEFVVFAKFVATQTCEEEGSKELTEKQRNKMRLIGAMLVKSGPKKVRDELSSILNILEG